MIASQPEIASTLNPLHKNLHPKLQSFLRAHQTTEIVVITPHTTFAQQFKKIYIELNKKNLTVWQTPQILSYQTWLKESYEAHCTLPPRSAQSILSNTEMQLLSLNILHDLHFDKTNTHNNSFPELINSYATAKLLLQAYQTVQEYELNIEDAVFEVNLEYSVFKKWYQLFTKCCKKHHWLTRFDLATELIQQLSILPTLAPKTILLIGFIKLPLQYQRLHQLYRDLGYTVHEFAEIFTNKIDDSEQLKISFTSTNSLFESFSKAYRAARIILDDQTTEWLTMARWIKHIYLTQPKASIGCVVPNLKQNLVAVQRCFEDVFLDILSTHNPEENILPYQFKVKPALNQYPIIRTALNCLRIQSSLVFKDFAKILLSNYIGGAEQEYLARAELEVSLRKKNFHTIHLNLLLDSSTTLYKLLQPTPLLLTQLVSIVKLLKQQNELATLNEWQIYFNEVVNLMGWTDSNLNFAENACKNLFLQALARLTTLGKITSQKLSLDQALQHLQLLLLEVEIFKDVTTSRIHIGDINHMQAVHFDYLWVSGLHQTNWPPTQVLPAFIPQHLLEAKEQNKIQAAFFLDYQQQTQQFIEFSSQCIFSHAKFYEEEKTSPSLLLTHLPLITSLQLPLSEYQPIMQQIHTHQQLKNSLEVLGISLQEGSEVRGGADVIKQQALCAFKAYAKHRLHAQELAEATLGLREKERGIVLHRVLERIWQQLKSHYALSALTDEDLQHLIQEQVQQSFSELIEQTQFSASYLNHEKIKFQKIIFAWLKHEKTRTPFHVYAIEQTQKMVLGNLIFKMRVDRIDEIDGQWLLIDYKTTPHLSITDWLQTKLKQPQLPLYALLASEKVMGLSFALLYSIPKFKGLSQHDLTIPGIQKVSTLKKWSISWENLQNAWLHHLSQLSHAFQIGFATPHPTHGVKTCASCPYPALCRIHDNNK